MATRSSRLDLNRPDPGDAVLAEAVRKDAAGEVYDRQTIQDLSAAARHRRDSRYTRLIDKAREEGRIQYGPPSGDAA